MKFMFDLDDTLVSGDIILEISKRLIAEGDPNISRTYSNANITDYDLRDLPEHLRSIVRLAFADPEYVWIKKPIVGSFYFLYAIESMGHQTGVITARPTSIEAETKRFIPARFPGVKFELGVHIINRSNSVDVLIPSKKELLEKIKPDFYFDDNCDHCVEANLLGIETFLVSNKNTPWNHNFAKQMSIYGSPIKVIRNIAFFPEARL